MFWILSTFVLLVVLFVFSLYEDRQESYVETLDLVQVATIEIMRQVDFERAFWKLSSETKTLELELMDEKYRELDAAYEQLKIVVDQSGLREVIE